MLIKTGIGIGALCCLIFLLVTYRSVYLSAGMLILFAYMFFSVWKLANECRNDQIITISGQITDIELSPLRRKSRIVYFMFEDKRIKLLIKQRFSKIQQGDLVIVFVSFSDPLYEQDGSYVISNYHAINIKSAKADFEDKKI